MIVQSMRYNTLPKDVGATTKRRAIRHGDEGAQRIRAAVKRLHAERSRRLHAQADAILAERGVR